jgi:hypothetical protein
VEDKDKRSQGEEGKVHVEDHHAQHLHLLLPLSAHYAHAVGDGVLGYLPLVNMDDGVHHHFFHVHNQDFLDAYLVDGNMCYAEEGLRRLGYHVVDVPHIAEDELNEKGIRKHRNSDCLHRYVYFHHDDHPYFYLHNLSFGRDRMDSPFLGKMNLQLECNVVERVPYSYPFDIFFLPILCSYSSRYSYIRDELEKVSFVYQTLLSELSEKS